VLRLLFSKMNSGVTASNWRLMEATSNMGRTTGYGSTKANVLNQSFRQEEEGEEEVEEGTDIGLAMVQEEGLFSAHREEEDD